MKKTAAVITVSDKGSRGERIDTSGPALRDILTEYGLEVIYTSVIPDEADMIKNELISVIDEKKPSLVLTTGGTGFSKRDVTPEATKAVIERDAPGISETMRAASMAITPRGCLSRGVSGIRGSSMIVNLPGSKKAACENILSVINGLLHGLDILHSDGSNDCASAEAETVSIPSLDQWLEEAKKDINAAKCGMYLAHNGIVRATPRAIVRPDEHDKAHAQASSDCKPADTESFAPVTAVDFSYDEDRLKAAVDRVRLMPGIYYVRVWLNKGIIAAGGSLMLVLVGGDIRPHVINALEALVNEIKTKCVRETELYI